MGRLAWAADAGSATMAVSLLVSWLGDLGYAVWLVVVLSLVYTATRHERLAAILDHAWRFALKVVGLLFLVGVLVWLAVPDYWVASVAIIVVVLLVVFWQSLVLAGWWIGRAPGRVLRRVAVRGKKASR